MHEKSTLGRSEYERFCKMWKDGEYAHRRFGQAFHQHFKLEKMAPSRSLDKLYQTDGEEARRMIFELFDFQ